jgi:hypothetical protein
MNNFLEKLKVSLDTGVKDESVKAGFDEIVAKAELIESQPGRVQELSQKAVEAQESRKPLTKEEIKELEFQAMKQQQKIDEFEFQTILQAALVNADLAVEKLTNKIKEFIFVSTQLRDESIPVKDKKVLVKELLKAISTIESHVELEKQASVIDYGIFFRQD